MNIIAIILILLAVIIAALGWFMAGYTMMIHAQTLDDARAWQEERYSLDWYDEAHKEDYIVTSYDGYELHCQVILQDESDIMVSGHNVVDAISTDEKLVVSDDNLKDAKSNKENFNAEGTPHSLTDTNNECKCKDKYKYKYVIISHGYTDNRFGALKYARIYRKLGYNVIIYDLRGHGLNEPTFCTYSARESLDLLSIVEDTRKRYDNVQILGLHGESLGAATSVAVLGKIGSGNEGKLGMPRELVCNDIDLTEDNSDSKYGKVDSGKARQGYDKDGKVDSGKATQGYDRGGIVSSDKTALDKITIDFVVADCPFESLSKILKDGMASYHTPTAVVELTSLFAKLRCGYSFSDMRPIDCLQENHVPILFVHGADDTFIRPENSEDMAKVTKGYSELVIIPGAGHAESVLADPNGYEESVKQFLQMIDVDQHKLYI